MSAVSASIAACSSAPTISISTMLPMPARQHHHAHDALGIDAPVVARHEDIALKRPASFVSLADARACKPSLLLMVMLALIIDAGLRD
jgi:hypothetical protein